MATVEEKFNTKNCIVSQLESVISDLEHMTSGNFMHNRASAKLLANSALKEVDKVIVEQREIDIEKACEWIQENIVGERKYMATLAGKDFIRHTAVEDFRKAMMEE